MGQTTMIDHGPLMHQGEDFIYLGKAYRALCKPFTVGGAVGSAVLARRLEWFGEAAHAYGDQETIPAAGLVAVNFGDESIFRPEDPEGEHYGLLDNAANEPWF
jgi:hypothetical protein